MILTEEIKDPESFFQRAFPNLKEYRTNENKDQKIETVFFNWQKEDYAFCIFNRLKVISYGEKIGLIEHLLVKQVEIDSLKKTIVEK